MFFYNLLIAALHIISTFGFQLEHPCGQQQISLKYQNIQRNAFIYIPKIICTATSFSDYVNAHNLSLGIPFNTSIHQMDIPTLVALHCLSGNPLWELNKWTKYSEKYGFIVIAPKGGDVDEKPSWNVDVCCDPAVDKGYDDIGYIQHVLTRIIANIPLLYPYISISFEQIFMTGFSNGAFMVDKLGWNSVGNLFPKILGIAPMAGYIYDYQNYVNLDHKKDDNHYHPLAVWMHHSRTDIIVKIDGCCPTNDCAAKISERSNECVSVEQEWNNWMRWNQCNVEKYNISFSNIAQKHGQYDCAFATKSDHECLAETRLCIFLDTSHSEWAQKFPLEEEVILFFVQTLCEENDGILRDNICDCNGRKNVGRYCGVVKDINWDEINRSKKYFMQYEREHNGTDEYLQSNQNEKFVKKKRHFRRERQQPSMRTTQYSKERLSLGAGGFAVILVMIIICICLIGWKLYKRKSKKRYQLLPQKDEDFDVECHPIEDNKSDESNHSNGIIRNRRKISVI